MREIGKGATQGGRLDGTHEDWVRRICRTYRRPERPGTPPSWPSIRLGVNTVAADAPSSDHFEARKALLPREVPIYEGPTGPEKWGLYGLPIKIAGGSPAGVLTELQIFKERSGEHMWRSSKRA